MSEQELMELRGNADHLGAVVTYIRRMKRLTIPTHHTPPNFENFEGNFEGNFDFDDMPTNKALLSVVTTKDERGAKVFNVSKESAAEKAG
jgi:uncharacterized protein (DUF2249 family)